jgi:hypothetical protein
MAATENTLCSPNDTASKILSRFDDAGFNPYEVVSLLASLVLCPFLDGRPPHGSSHSHSIATSSFAKPGARFDCTPHVFDTQFFAEVDGNAQCLIPDALKIRIPADTALAQGWCLPIRLANRLELTYVS